MTYKANWIVKGSEDLETLHLCNRHFRENGNLPIMSQAYDLR